MTHICLINYAKMMEFPGRKERITYTDLGDGATVVTETTMRTRHMNITFGEEFSMELPKGMGTMWNICSRFHTILILKKIFW